MATISKGAEGTGRRARFETALAGYPDVDPVTLGEMIDWFNHEASPADVRAVSQAPALRRPYRRFKADHLDRRRGANLAWSALLSMVVGICLTPMACQAL